MSSSLRVESPSAPPNLADERCWERHPNDVRVTPLHEDVVLEVRPCPVCGSTKARPKHRIERTRFEHVDCTECGTGALHPMPSAEEIAAFYPPAYYGSPKAKFEPMIERAVRLVGARRAAFLAKDLPEGARVLDIGCGRGVLLSTLADRGLEAHGVEIDEDVAAGADERLEIRIAGTLGEADYPTAHFDLVVLWHVFEHLADPSETLAEIHRVLKPGGRLVVAVPNYSSLQSRWSGSNWFHLDPPRHLYHYPVEALRRIITSHGFDCRSEHHFSLRQNPFGWVQSLLNSIPGMPRNGLYAMLMRKTESNLFPRSTRLGMRLAYWLGMPVALLFSMLCAVLRSGASVHVVAERSADGGPEVGEEQVVAKSNAPVPEASVPGAEPHD